MKRDHVYLYVEVEGERKFRGFFINQPTAEAWVKKQDLGPYEISDEPPVRKEAATEPAKDQTEAARVDEGMAKALATVKEAKTDG